MNIENEEEMKDYPKNIYKLKLVSGKSLVELSTYKEIALWWFVNFDFLTFLRKSQNLSNDNKEKTKKECVIHCLKQNALFNLIPLIYGLSISKLCKINVNLYKLQPQNKKIKILVVAQNVEWKKIWSSSEKIFKKSDAFFDSTISLLEKNNPDFEIVTTYPVGYSVSGLKIIVDKRKNQKDIIHKPFEYFFSLDLWKERQKATKYFSGLWNEIKKDKKFCNLFEYNGKKLYSIESKVSNYFNRTFGGIVQEIEMAKKMIDREKPDLILLQNEYSSFEMSLVVAGKLKGVPTLAVQHGAIGRTHNGYMHFKDEISSSGIIRSPYYPIPDKTAVFGRYFEDLLTNVSSYPEKSVVVTGQPRYDVLYHVSNIYNGTSFLGRYNIPKNN
ncbi:MAG: hypothetical protein KAW93_05875, partial [Methanogenium sp.]|nr:hypothetical protein [Methanogenium sp.]